MKAVDLSYTESGPASGPTVVLLHGFPFDGTMWQGTAEGLASSGRRVIVPDLRGHGKSHLGDGPATMEAMAGDVAALLGRLGVTPGAVVGFSMGGYVALQMALREPEHVRALALVDTRAEADSAEAAAGRAKTIEAVGEKGMQALVDGMLPKLFHPGTAQRRPDVVAAARSMMLANPPAGAVAALEGMRMRPDVRARLAGLRLPCLVVVGEADGITPPDSASRMAQAFRGSDYELIPEAGHMAPLENPSRFNAVLSEWLDRVMAVA